MTKFFEIAKGIFSNPVHMIFTRFSQDFHKIFTTLSQDFHKTFTTLVSPLLNLPTAFIGMQFNNTVGYLLPSNDGIA
jgi:hypothetical protein